MALTCRVTLICDDIRREDNGKLMFLGIYTPNIVVPQLPAALSLSAFQLWEADAPGAHQFRLLVRHTDSGATVIDGATSIDVPSAGTGFLTLKMGVLRFETAGAYELLMMLDGQETAAARHTFHIVVRRGTEE